MIQPREIAHDSFVIPVVAFADLHGSNLSQAHFQVSPKGILMQWLTASLHVALNNVK